MNEISARYQHLYSVYQWAFRSNSKTFNYVEEGEAVLCSVVRAELLFGALGSQHPEKTTANQRQFINLFHSLPFDDLAAEQYAVIRADLKAKGTPIGSNDLMIAAIALANNLMLVTHNTREFQRVNGLKLEDWENA